MWEKCHRKILRKKSLLVTHRELTETPLVRPEEDSQGGTAALRISYLLAEGEISGQSWSTWWPGIAGWSILDRARAHITMKWDEKVLNRAQFWPDWNRRSSDGSLQWRRKSWRASKEEKCDRKDNLPGLPKWLVGDFFFWLVGSRQWAISQRAAGINPTWQAGNLRFRTFWI